MSMYDHSQGSGDKGSSHSTSTSGTVGRETRTSQLTPAAPAASRAPETPAVPSIPMDAESLADRHAQQDADLATAMGTPPAASPDGGAAPRPMRNLALMDDLDGKDEESSPRRRPAT